MDVGTDLATFEADGDDRVRAPRPLGLAGRLVTGQVKLSQHEVQPLETLATGIACLPSPTITRQPWQLSSSALT